MANEIEPGTIDCEPGTLGRAILDVLSTFVAPEDLPKVEVAFKRFAAGVAGGWVINVTDSIDNGKYLLVDNGKIVGGDGGGGGGGAPVGASYVVASAHPDLTAERVATSSPTVTVDTSVAGQMRWSVPDATTTAKGVVELASHDEVAAGKAVQSNDPRLVVPGPKTIYEVDFSVQPTQVVAADGTVVIDGKNWLAENVDRATTFQVLNGSGLQIVAVAGTNRTWSGVSNTSPALHVDLEELSTEANRYDLPLRIWAYFSAYDLPENLNTILVGVYSPAVDGYSAVVSGSAFQRTSNVSAPGLARGATFTKTTITLPDVLNANTLVWSAPIASIAEMWSGIYAGGWPSLAGGLIQVGHDVSGYGTILSENDFVRRPGARLIVSPLTRSTSGAPGFTLERLRVTLG